MSVELAAGPMTITHSSRACAKVCLRKYQHRYELGIIPEHESRALVMGTLWHDMHDARAKGRDPWASAFVSAAVENAYDKEMIARMFMAYDWWWDQRPEQGFTIIESELAFEIPVLNPETGAKTPLWVNRGKIDAIVRMPDGQLAILERKTTRYDIDPGSDYWTRLRLDQQITAYFQAARELGHNVAKVLYDVAKKPNLRPLKATPPESRKYTKDGRLYSQQREEDETPEEYGERLAATLSEVPGEHFARIEIPRLAQDIEGWREDLWDDQQAIRRCQIRGRFPRTTGACLGSGWRCEYLPVCQEGFAGGIPSGYVRLPADQIHQELV